LCFANELFSTFRWRSFNSALYGDDVKIAVFPLFRELRLLPCATFGTGKIHSGDSFWKQLVLAVGIGVPAAIFDVGADISAVVIDVPVAAGNALTVAVGSAAPFGV
jgi:hypothetical protein